MIEEPYRWVEAIANRRKYIETQLASGSPIRRWDIATAFSFYSGADASKDLRIYDRKHWARSVILAISSACPHGRHRTGQHRGVHPIVRRRFVAATAHYSLSP